MDHWITNEKGIVLFLEPGEEFEQIDDKGETDKKVTFSVLWPFVTKYKKYLFQLALGMLLGTLFTLVGPFLTQALVDKGIGSQNLNFVYLILIAQVFLYIGSTINGAIRSWILMHLSTRINISFISDFFKKLLNLPVKFYRTVSCRRFT